ncbi:MAG: hypothetical protein AB7F86_03765 [Bdellovibrionales bacterium]
MRTKVAEGSSLNFGWIVVVAVALIASACAHQGIRPSEERAFPDGSYRQDVEVTPKGQSKAMRFQGALLLSGKSRHLVGLSPMGTTVFRLQESQDQDRKIEIYDAELKQHFDTFESLWDLLKAIFNQKRGTKSFKVGEAKVQFLYPDWDGVPQRIQVAHPHFDLQIQTISYGPTEGAKD